MQQSYQAFLASKSMAFKPCGIDPLLMPHMLKGFQSALLARALKQGRFCLWAECGLGKTVMQLAWADNVARYAQKPVLILAPLAVVEQTANIEASKFGIKCAIAASQKDIASAGIYIANYEKLSKFDSSLFAGIVLDESSILKSYTGKIRTSIIEFCQNIHFRLACSATPSPNDLMELGNHAEFIGAMTQAEMLATFFTHDGGNTSKWRLKGHTKKEKFWHWVASWAVMVRSPEDIGFNGTEYQLPALHKKLVQVDTPVEASQGMLFAQKAQSLSEQRKIAKLSMEDRCWAAAQLAEDEPDKQWLIWCNLNDESALLAKLIPDAVEIKGSTSDSARIKAMQDFQQGKLRVLVTKPSIAGFGMNWQNCDRMIFVGLNHSYEQFYQALKRCHRFGQKDEVIAYLVAHQLEGAVLDSIERKSEQSMEMAESMAKAMQLASSWEYGAVGRSDCTYTPSQEMQLPEWMRANISTRTIAAIAA